MNHTHSKTSFLLACSLALIALPAAFAGEAANVANAGKHSEAEMFKMMDTDGNGFVSRAEQSASSKQMFLDTDTNHDGMVTLAEMTVCCDKMNDGKPAKGEMSAADMIKMHDQNGDGQLSAAEQAAGCDMMFDKMDTNHDGQLSPAECTAGHKMMMKGK